MVLFHLSYISDKEHSKTVRGWLIIPAVISHLGKAAGVPGTVSTAPPPLPPAFQEFPVWSTTSVLWKGLSRPEETERGMNQCTCTCFPPCQTSAWFGFKEMKPLLCTDLAAYWVKCFFGQWDSWSPLSIQRTGFGVLTSHTVVTTRRAIQLLCVLPIKKLKGYFWNKGGSWTPGQDSKKQSTLLLKIPP